MISVQLLTLELVTWSAGTDSGTVCRVLRILADIVGQPGSLPQTLWPYDVAPTPPTPARTKKTTLASGNNKDLYLRMSRTVVWAVMRNCVFAHTVNF